MRSLLPSNQISAVEYVNNKPITQEQYNALLEQINQYKEEVETTSAEFDNLEEDLRSAWCTGTLTADTVNAITASINCINNSCIITSSLNANQAFAHSLCTPRVYTDCVTASCRVNTDVVNATCGVMTTRVDASCVVADDIKVNNAVHYTTSCTDTANITNADITCETVFNSEIQTACIYDLNSDTAQLDIACINTAHIGDADVANQLDTYKLTAEFIKHNQGAQAQTLVTPDDFYIELPYFANGTYRLISVDAQLNELWSISVHNESTSNYVITWSANPGVDNYLEDLYIYQNKFYFHGNSNGKAQTIYHVSDTLENETDPTIYTDGWPFDTTSLDVQKYWIFQFNHGTKFFRNVSFANDTAITSPLKLLSCSDITCVNLPVTYDTTEDTNAVLYIPDQAVDTCCCVTFNRITTADYTDPDTGVTSTSCAYLPYVEIPEDLIAPHTCVTCTTACYENAENGLIVDCTGTYIKSTGEDTCDYINPIATYKADECWECANDGLVAYDKNTNSLKPADDVHIVGNLTVECTLTACGPVIACQDVSIACDLHVNGDAYVAGTLHYTDTEVINSTADNIILRQNNNTPLSAGQHSGVIINNATATSSTAIVTDCTGTVRVGNASATTTTYTDIYLSSADGKWYSDDALTTEVTPSGDLTAWSSSDKTDDYTHYTNAVFSVYSVTSTQPIATRDEEANMVDQMPTIWNATCKRFETTTPANGCACMSLVTCIDSITGCLGMTWQDAHPAATLCRYQSMACYCADVANICANTIVVIDDEENYVVGEDR